MDASFRRALALAPGNAVVLRRVANGFATLGRLDDAIQLDQQALTQDPLSPVVYLNYGLRLRACDRFAESEAAYRKAFELSPQVDAHAYLALTLLAQGRIEEALTQAQQDPEEWRRLNAMAI